MSAKVDPQMERLFGKGTVVYEHTCGCYMVAYGEHDSGRDTTYCEEHARAAWQKGGAK